MNADGRRGARAGTEDRRQSPSSAVELLAPGRGNETQLGRGSFPVKPFLVKRGLAGVTTSQVNCIAASAALSVAFAVAWFIFAMKRRFDAIKSASKRVVVIGGGFAGMQIVKDLASACEVTLLDTRDYFEYTPGVLSALVGGGPLRHSVGNSSRAAKLDRNGGGRNSSDAREGAKARIKKLQRSLREVAPGKANVVHVNSPHALTVRHGVIDISRGEQGLPDDKIHWDYLVFATGSLYSSPIKPASFQPEGSVAKDAVSSGRCLHFADTAARMGRASHILVVGGGVVGVELAAEFALSNGRAPQRITLAHKAPRLLDNLPADASDRATRWLKQHGVDVLLGEKFVLASAEEDEGHKTIHKRYVGEHSGKVIVPDEVIITAGARPATDFLRQNSTIPDTDDACRPPVLHVPLDAGGGIRIEKDTFRVDCRLSNRKTENWEESAEQLSVFCVGDAASKSPERYLASFAHWEAEYVAHNILRDIDGSVHGHSRGTALKKFTPPPRLMCISLGPWDGIFIWGDRVLLSGIIAGMVKLGIEMWFKNFWPAPYAVAKLLPHMKQDEISP